MKLAKILGLYITLLYIALTPSSAHAYILYELQWDWDNPPSPDEILYNGEGWGRRAVYLPKWPEKVWVWQEFDGDPPGGVHLIFRDLEQFVEYGSYGSPRLHDGIVTYPTHGDRMVVCSPTLGIAGYPIGDLTLDGRVDGTDFLRLQAGFGMDDPGYLDGDISGNGVVDGWDFLSWQMAYSNAIYAPEPATMLLLLPAIFLKRKR